MTINLRRRGERFRFHPDELSQLRSRREGRDVLQRNGLNVVALDYGIRGLFAFKIVGGVKPSRA